MTRPILGRFLERFVDNLPRTATSGAELCDDCPPLGYPTDKTRCLECPRRTPPEGRSGRGEQ